MEPVDIDNVIELKTVIKEGSQLNYMRLELLLREAGIDCPDFQFDNEGQLVIYTGKYLRYDLSGNEYLSDESLEGA